MWPVDFHRHIFNNILYIKEDAMPIALEYLTSDSWVRLKQKLTAYHWEIVGLQFLAKFNMVFEAFKIDEMDESVRADFQAIYEAFKQVNSFESAAFFLDQLVGDELEFVDNETGPFSKEMSFVHALYMAYTNAYRDLFLSYDENILEQQWHHSILRELIRAIVKQIEIQLNSKGLADITENLKKLRLPIFYKNSMAEVGLIKGVIASGLDMPFIEGTIRSLLSDYATTIGYWNPAAKMDLNFINLVNLYVAEGTVLELVEYSITRLFEHTFCQQGWQRVEAVFYTGGAAGASSSSSSESLGPEAGK
jgi:hypothetical protein